MKHLILGLLLVSLLMSGCIESNQTDDEFNNYMKINESNETLENDSLMNNSEMLNNTNMSAEYEIESSTVTYFENVRGFLAKPSQAGQYPGVVMIHEWWGLNDNIKDMAKMLASQGYTVLAVDLYEGEYAETSNKARELVTSLDQQRALNNLKSAINYLKQEESVTKIASLGWCFGGGQSMQLALSGEQMDATIIYYGNLVTNESQLQQINWPVLGIFGDQDTSIPAQTVNQFDSSLDNLGIQNEIYLYPGVGHAFANPSGANYAPNETKDAWEKTLSFLEKNLKN